MKLSQIWNSASVWGTLSVLKKPPKLAYRLLKYEKKIEREMQVIKKQHDALVYKHAGEAPPKGDEIKVVKLAEDTPQFKAYYDEFNEFCKQTSDLPWIGITMDELIEGLDTETSNVLSEHDIELLEPFFTEPAKPDLKLVEHDTQG